MISQLNYQTFLFQIVQFSMSHLFSPYLNIKQLYLIHRYEGISCYDTEPELTSERW